MNKMLNINEIVDSISITHKFDKPYLKFLNTSDVEKGKIVNIVTLPISELKGQAKKTIQKDDILFSEVRPKNKHYAYVDIDDCSDYVVSTKLMVLRKFNDEVDNKYFYYSLINDRMLEILQKRAENRICSFPQITFELLSEYKVRVPHIDIQKQIAHLLETLDSKIDLNNKINSEIDNFIKLLYEYWFIQFDFPNDENKPYKKSKGCFAYNELLKQNIPEKWEIKTLQDIANISTDQLFPEEDCYYEHYSIPIFDEIGTFLVENGKNIRSNKFIVKPFDVLVSKLNPKFSRILCADDKENMISSTEFVVFRCKTKEKRALLYSILKSDRFKLYCEKNSTGSSNSHRRVAPDIMADFKIPYNESVYKNFVDKILYFVEKQIVITKENQELNQLRDFLIPMLMNGQITVLASDEDNLSEDKIIEKSLEFWQSHGKMDIDQFARENGILVYKDNEQRKGAVSYNKEKDLYEIAVKDPRDNFTIAHEIGHILKHKKELKNGTLGRKSEESGSKIMEYEADSLAAEILMPEEYVLQYMQDENKTGKEFLDEKFIKECAKHFDVNPPAMNIRLKNLGFKVPYIR